MTGVLLKAVGAGRVRQVRLLLDSGINVEYRDDCGQTALIRAVFVEHSRQRVKIHKLLLQHGAKVSSADIVGRNALSWACLYGHDRDVRILLERADVHLDLNQADMNGQTALFHAGTSGNAATVKLMVDALRRYSLNMDTPNANGITPLMQAMKLGHDVCASILQKQGGASVGINNDMAVTEELANAERWAIRKAPPHICTPTGDQARINQVKEGRKDQKKICQFPPILPQSAIQKIKYRENRAGQLRVQTPVDSEDDSTYGSEVSYYTDESFASINDPEEVSLFLPEGTPRTFGKSDTRMAICSVSMTSSTENNMSSDEGDDAADRENDDWDVFQPCRDLPRMYCIYEQLRSPSYRPPAVPPLPAPVSTGPSFSESSASETSSLKDVKYATRTKKDVQKISELRRMLFRKQVRHILSLPDVAPGRYPTPVLDSSSSSENDTVEDIGSKRTVLPRVMSSLCKAHSTRSNEPRENYSEV